MTSPQFSPHISVIIPARDEASGLSDVLWHLTQQRPGEIIVVDGESRDGTGQIARPYADHVIVSPPGRGRQMNRGAAAARGEVLLFLHADTTLPDGFVEDVAAALRQPDVVAGAFLLGIDGDERAFRWIERLVRWRSRRWQRPYGDQALFMRAATFEAVGGYPDQPVMEDVALVRALRRRGRIAIVDKAVRTSARRWRATGLWRTTGINLFCAAAYGLGASAARIDRIRRRAFGRRGDLSIAR
jgi:rSAM/selenodomain-associated transferase 2